MNEAAEWIEHYADKPCRKVYASGEPASRDWFCQEHVALGGFLLSVPPAHLCTKNPD
jgi:hypothetical protein